MSISRRSHRQEDVPDGCALHSGQLSALPCTTARQHAFVQAYSSTLRPESVLPSTSTMKMTLVVVRMEELPEELIVIILSHLTDTDLENLLSTEQVRGKVARLVHFTLDYRIDKLFQELENIKESRRQLYSYREKTNTREQITRRLQHILELARITRRIEAEQRKIVKQAEAWAKPDGYDDIETTLCIMDFAVKLGVGKLDLDQFPHLRKELKYCLLHPRLLARFEIYCMHLFQVHFEDLGEYLVQKQQKSAALERYSAQLKDAITVMNKTLAKQDEFDGRHAANALTLLGKAFTNQLRRRKYRGPTRWPRRKENAGVATFQGTRLSRLGSKVI